MAPKCPAGRAAAVHFSGHLTDCVQPGAPLPAFQDPSSLGRMPPPPPPGGDAEFPGVRLAVRPSRAREGRPQIGFNDMAESMRCALLAICRFRPHLHISADLLTGKSARVLLPSRTSKDEETSERTTTPYCRPCRLPSKMLQHGDVVLAPDRPPDGRQCHHMRRETSRATRQSSSSMAVEAELEHLE